MESQISEKVQRLTRILSEEADKFPRISVSQYSTGTYGYDWKVYQDDDRQLGTISFTTELALSDGELRAAFRHELKALTRCQAALNAVGNPPAFLPVHTSVAAQER
jgi:hypothetical protein